jgi:hypothetical protein
MDYRDFFPDWAKCQWMKSDRAAEATEFRTGISSFGKPGQLNLAYWLPGIAVRRSGTPQAAARTAA